MDIQTKKLCEMGFTQQQAEQALQRANNDVEKAIGYLFDGFPEEPVAQDKENDYVTIPPGNVPDYTPMVVTDDYDQAELESEIRGDQGSYQEDYESSQYELEDSIFESTPEIRGPMDIPAVLPKVAGFMENYVLPILIVASQLDEFTTRVMAVEAENTATGKGAKGASTKTGPDSGFSTELDTESGPAGSSGTGTTGTGTSSGSGVSSEHVKGPTDISSVKFIKELKKLIGFLTPISQRMFITAFSLPDTLPSEFRKDFSIIEDSEDLISKFYETLAKHIEIGSLFTSHVDVSSEETSSDIHVIPIDLESRSDNIYKSLSNLFWSEGNIGNVSLSFIAPVLTIHVHGDIIEDDYSQHPFKLDETIFPEIYHSKFAPAVAQMSSSKVEINNQRSTVTAELMQLSSFEGKKIKNILAQVEASFDDSDPESLSDLHNLNEGIKQQSASLMTQLEALNQEYCKSDIFAYENVIAKVTEAKGSALTQYKLIGVIISDTEYFYRSKRSVSEEEPWVYFSAGFNKMRKVHTYNIEPVDFEAVKTYVSESSRKDFSNGLILFYASEDELSKELNLVLPESLKQYFTEDNESLTEQIARENESDQESAAQSYGESTGHEIEEDDVQGEAKDKGDTDLIDM